MSLVLVFNDMCIRASEWVHASVANVVSVYVCVCVGLCGVHLCVCLCLCVYMIAGAVSARACLVSVIERHNRMKGDVWKPPP